MLDILLTILSGLANIFAATSSTFKLITESWTWAKDFTNAFVSFIKWIKSLVDLFAA